MPNEVLDEDNLNEQIRIRRNMMRSLDYHIRLLQQDSSGDNLVSQTNLVNDLYAHISTIEHEIRLLQEKLRKLGEFSSRTSGLFSKGSDYLQGVLRGVNVLNHATVNPITGTYVLTGGVSLFDLYVPKEGDDFYSKLQQMNLAEIEELFGGRIKSYQSYTQTGYGLTIKSSEDWEQLRAILARYRYLKSIGDPGLAHVTMLKNLDPADKAVIDKLTLQGMMNHKVGWFGTGITLLRGPYMDWQYMAGSPQDRARFDYLYYRFNQLMAEQPIDWRDPDFATKYAAYIKKTGLNPFTGKKATPGEQVMAKYYGPAKGISQGLAIASLLAGPKVMTKFGQGKAGGKIPYSVYKKYRVKSIKNPNSNTMTLGKYEPSINSDGSLNWKKPGPGAYTVKAGNTTYFDLGDDWNKLTIKYKLDPKGKDMFGLFNRPALDDAVAQGKIIRFSHDPTLPAYEGSALDWEWNYLKHKYGYKDLDYVGGYWYASK